MADVRALLAKLFLVVNLALAQFPRVVVLLDVLHQPTIARVFLTRRRMLTYSEFFTLRDQEGAVPHRLPGRRPLSLDTTIRD